MFRFGPQLIVAGLAAALVCTSAVAQTSPSGLASVRAVRVVPQKDGPTIEIYSTQSLTPTITQIEGPSRLVIDLPGANMAFPKRRIDFRSEEVSGVRINQFQDNPPIARVVVDLAQPITYSWDASGNRLTVRLHPSPNAAAVHALPPSVPALTNGAQPLAVPVSPVGNGAIMLAGSRISGGSAVTAGSDTAVLRLGRGGEIRVCPGTTVSVTSGKNGQDLMLGMSTGSLEAHYALSNSADSVLTPDFRILMAGPGEFHYAISADAHGNTCVRSLPGNTASVIVSELMGDGTYQVKPSEQIVFSQGRLATTGAPPPMDCGCPPPNEPILRASASTPVVSDENQPSTLRLPDNAPVSPPPPVSGHPTDAPPNQVTVSMADSTTAPLPAPQPNEVHVQVDAPFVFRATDPKPTPPPPVAEARTLPISTSTKPSTIEAAALPPQAAQNETPADSGHHGFFGKMRGFFAALFK